MADLFGDDAAAEPRREALAPGAVLLRGRALPLERELFSALDAIVAEAPFRRMTTPGGFEMSVAMTNCGAAGWITDRKGYRYDPVDPASGRPWPPLPLVFRQLARDAAAEAGFPGFAADSCLLNRYEPGTRLSLHQDRNERDFACPIVSVSLGLPALFLFGGARRTDRPRRVPLRHGDVVVWGGPARLFYHGVLTVKAGDHPATGRQRFNLTLRKAL
ncbi:MAG TPA: DNA oxidative demethylase AlkB [Stellaceae bacterium]|nr:DNA oxidative demethylase AlkB [Stellaceae bacterium]